MKIYLIGMPGSGKSTFGKRLAKQLQYEFTDLDTRIITQEEMIIPDIFARKGEDYFRLAERKALEHTEQLKNVIIATGGGTPCFFDNMEWMKRSGLSIWLNISPVIIATRINSSPEASQQRPLFAGKSEAEIVHTLTSMYQQRLPFYQQAQLHITEKEAKPTTVAKKIKELVGNE